MTRHRALVERLGEYCRLAALGWSDRRIALEMGISHRTAQRYGTRLRAGESPELTDAELAHWDGRRPATVGKPAVSRTRQLLAGQKNGARVVGPDGQAVTHRPLSPSDSLPWTDSRGERYFARDCRTIYPGED